MKEPIQERDCASFNLFLNIRSLQKTVHILISSLKPDLIKTIQLTTFQKKVFSNFVDILDVILFYSGIRTHFMMLQQQTEKENLHVLHICKGKLLHYLTTLKSENAQTGMQLTIADRNQITPIKGKPIQTMTEGVQKWSFTSVEEVYIT